MRFLGLGIGGLSHQSCMSLDIGTNNIVGGSINAWASIYIHWFNVNIIKCYIKLNVGSTISIAEKCRWYHSQYVYEENTNSLWQ